MENLSLEQLSADLADAIERALPGWVLGCVDRIMKAWAGSTPDAVQAEAHLAARAARDEVGPVVRGLLALDIDEQTATPLTILREAVVYPTVVLLGAGVPPVRRDDYSVERFPEDIYDLTPANFADIDPALAELGLAWGAAKAWTHRRRHSTSTPHAAPDEPGR